MKINKYLIWLIIIISIGCCFQLLYMFFVINPHIPGWPDTKDYLSLANTLANEHSYSKINVYRSPGYPYFLGIIISISGNNLVLIRLVHIVFHAVFLTGVYLLGKEWKGEKFGLLLTFISCLYPYYTIIPIALCPEAVLIFISSWIIYLLLRIDRSLNYYNLLYACLLISLGTITRPTYLVISTVFFTFYLFKRTSISDKIKVFVFLMLIPASILLSWGYRNLKIHNHFIISTAANYNLFLCFNDNTTIYTKANCAFPKKIQDQLSIAKNKFERDDIYKKSAIEFIKKNPWKSVYLLSVRIIDLWNPIPHTVVYVSLFKKVISGLPYFIVLVLSIFGIKLSGKEKNVYILIAILILNSVVNGIFGVSVRYRVVFDIILLIFFAEVIYNKSKYILKKNNCNKDIGKFYLFF
jgi:4-amino-4-deoxy-L-arabinose transferase-like glycosyltransferase